MKNIEVVQAERIAIGRFTNQSDATHRMATVPLSGELRRFYEEHVRNCLKTSSALNAKSASADATIASFATAVINNPDRFDEVSEMIGAWFADCFKTTREPVTHLAVVLVLNPDDHNRYLALLKLDPITMYQYAADETRAIHALPDCSRTLNRFAVVRAYDEADRFDIVYRNKPAMRDEDHDTERMWLDRFLGAVDVPTPRRLTELLVKETDRWLSAVVEDGELSPEIASKLRAAVNAVVQSTEVNVEQIASAILPSTLADEYVGRFKDKGMTETIFEPDINWARKQAKNTTYICDDGVKISGPSDAIDDVVQVMPKAADRKTRVVIETRKFQQK